MKFVRFNGGRTGIIVGEDQAAVLDIVTAGRALPSQDHQVLAELLPGDGAGSWSSMIERWRELRPMFQQLQAIGEGGGAGRHPLSSVTLEAPLPGLDRRIFSLGANTVAHIQGVSARLPTAPVTTDDIYKPKRSGADPVGFNVFADTVIGPGAVSTPPAFVQKLDYEGECAAIVGSGGRDQGLETVIWGYTAWNDLGMRDGHLGLISVMPSFGYSLNLWKNFDGANACGPWVVVDEGYDVGALRCEVFVNGSKRQDWNTRDMIYSFAELFDSVSRYTALRPGDMATSGTGAGTAMEGPLDSELWLKPGDVVEVRLEGVAPLVTRIGGHDRPAAPTFERQRMAEEI